MTMAASMGPEKPRPLAYGVAGGNRNRVRVWRVRGIDVAGVVLGAMYVNFITAFNDPGRPALKPLRWRWACPCLSERSDGAETYRSAQTQPEAFEAAIAHVRGHVVERALRERRV